MMHSEHSRGEIHSFVKVSVVKQALHGCREEAH